MCAEVTWLVLLVHVFDFAPGVPGLWPARVWL
jgi:hypothetical protein